jgi:two-component system, OmpR family, sensor histidine kinase KdpD
VLNMSTRPDPDALLRRATAEEARVRRGKLKIFFGMAAGVGKTYAMLEAAQRHRAARIDTVIGYVETHGRAETAALLENLEVLPRRQTQYRGTTLEEFDVDAARLRHPTLIIVDELAHTNAPGSRHTKRWQDILELIDSGIDVYTTLNVQHLDSLNDVIAKITGVQVRELIPDSVFDQADEIELVDLPAQELLDRLRQGKVYVPAQAQNAIENFFRAGNLIALRELALRRAADRVDAQMDAYRRERAIKSAWPVSDRILVCIGTSPFSASLLRSTKRMADRRAAQWIAAFVETPDYANASEEVRTRVLATLRLAEQLGAETVMLSGPNVTTPLLEYARSRNVSRIVIGKPSGPLWKRLLYGSILDELIQGSGDIDIYAISGDTARPPPTVSPMRRITNRRKDYVVALITVGLTTILCRFLLPVLTPTNLAMIYLLGVVFVALRGARGPALLASLLGVAAFDFFCVPPYLTFAVSDYEYVLTFIVMFIVALIVSNLTVYTKQQAKAAIEREARTNALYRISKQLSQTVNRAVLVELITAMTAETFRAKVVVILASDGLASPREWSESFPLDSTERGVAAWVLEHGQPAGKGTQTLPGAKALYLPLQTSAATIGVLGVQASDWSTLETPEQIHQLQAFAAQAALALERSTMAADAQSAAVRAETERTRTALLSAVSHDLRTPLTSITGAASGLLTQGAQLDDSTKHELLVSIVDEADRLSRLVNNLLEMTKLDSGPVELQKDWQSLEDIVGSALRRCERQLGKREIRIALPDLPPVFVDGLLFEQAFINLFENACKYAGSSARVEVTAEANGEFIDVEVRDYGKGFEAGTETKVFEKFYRGHSTDGRGAGLGLAIVRAIVEVHGGKIRAYNHQLGGAVVRFTVPAASTPQEVES